MTEWKRQELSARDDLPDHIRRRLLWHRRQSARKFARKFDQLIEAHIDPNEWLDEVWAAHRKHMGR